MEGGVPGISPGRCIKWMRRLETFEGNMSMLMKGGVAGPPTGKFKIYVQRQRAVGCSVGVSIQEGGAGAHPGKNTNCVRWKETAGGSGSILI